MAKISFATPPTPHENKPAKAAPVEASAPPKEPPTDKVEVSAALVVVEDRAPARVTSPAVAAGVTGEVSMSDIKLPRINLVQRVGKLADEFAPGTLLFEKQVVLSDGKTPVDLTPLQLRKNYQLKQEWGDESGDAPEVYDTVAEVRAAGGSLEWGDDRYFQEVAHIQFAIKLGEDVEGDEVTDLFPYQLGDSLYAVAIWTVASSAYTNLAKPIITASASLLRNGLFTGHYAVTTALKTNAKNSWYVPVPKFAGKHTPEAAQFFKEIAGL